MTQAVEKVGAQASISGLGVIQLGTALAGQRGFADVYADGATGIPVSAEEMDADGLRGFPVAWELASCTYNAGANTLTRDAVSASSNGNSPVNFGSGLKRVFVYLPVADVGDLTGAVRYDQTQLLAEPQKAQARSNIGAVTDYYELTSTPILGTASTLDVPGGGFNAAAGQVVKGNDTRLTNARAPTAHTQALSTLTQSGAALGDSPRWNGTAWAPAAGGITAGDIAGGTLPASFTTLASSGVASLGGVNKKPYTSGTLPISPVMYDQRLVVDAITPALGNPYVGGGSSPANVIWISPNWMVI